jgi:ABC-2 type transport system permease protein
MRQKTSYFNRALFLHTIARFWPVWAGYLILWLVSLMAMPDNLRYSGNPLSYVCATLPRMAYEFAAVMAFVFAAFSAMAVFSYLYHAKSAGMMGSLPLRRGSVFLTQTLAGIVCFWLINAAVFLLAAGMEAANGLLGEGLPYLMRLLALTCLLNLIFYGLAVFCAQLTGHILALPAVYIMLSFAAVVVETIVRMLMLGLIFGLAAAGSTLDFLSPGIMLMKNTGFSPLLGGGAAGGAQIMLEKSGFHGWLWIAVYAVLGVFLILAAFLLHRRRRMESAGDLVALRPLTPVFKYCFAAGCGLVLTFVLHHMIFDETRYAGLSMLLRILATLIIGAFIGYFAAEMMIKKSRRVFRGAWRGVAVLAFSLAALTCACEFDVFGAESRLPDMGSVGRASVTCAGAVANLKSAEGIEDTIALQSGIVSRKAEHERAVAEGKNTGFVFISYYDERDTVIMSRRYYIGEGRDMEALETLMNCREAVDGRRETDIPVTAESISYAEIGYTDASGNYVTEPLKAGEAYELFTQCVVPDMSEGTLGRVWLDVDEGYYESVYAASVNIELMERRPDGSYKSESFRTTVTVDARRTAAWISERGIELTTQSELNDRYRDDTGKRYAD